MCPFAFLVTLDVMVIYWMVLSNKQIISVCVLKQFKFQLSNSVSYVLYSVDIERSPDLPYVYVNSSGTIKNSKPIQVVSACSLETYAFPFDVQNCSLTFNSVLHTGKPLYKLTQTNLSWFNGKCTLYWLSTHRENYIFPLVYFIIANNVF